MAYSLTGEKRQESDAALIFNDTFNGTNNSRNNSALRSRKSETDVPKKKSRKGRKIKNFFRGICCLGPVKEDAMRQLKN